MVYYMNTHEKAGDPMERQYSRRHFLHVVGMTGVAVTTGTFFGCSSQAAQVAAKKPKVHELSSSLILVRGDDPKKMTETALEALGGIDKLVKPNDVVVVKPNIAWDRTPEQAATTNPAVVACVVGLCRKAGAKTVKVFDRTCNDARRSYDSSGIAKAAEEAGATVSYVLDRRFHPIAIPKGVSMKEWNIYEDAAAADVLINLPIAKQHGNSRLTLGFKNMMGIAGGNRGTWHPEIHQRLADFATITAVDLTIVDAYRILTAHGPASGTAADVRQEGLLVAGIDPVAVDAYCTTIFGLQPQEVGFVPRAFEHGLGEMDLQKIPRQEIKLA
jgi:uncharacterized protein (DUF362 family)